MRYRVAWNNKQTGNEEHSAWTTSEETAEMWLKDEIETFPDTHYWMEIAL